MGSRQNWKKREETEELEEESSDEDSRKEPTVDIRLTSVSCEAKARVRFDFKSLQYKEVANEDLIEDILSLPSKVILKEDLAKLEEQRKDALAAAAAKKAEDSEAASGGGEGTAKDCIDNLEGCEEVISKEELRKLDSQPNPFNFSERVSQTTRVVTRDQFIQTDPPPSTSFCINVGPSDIYDAYQKDFERKRANEREKEIEKEKEKATKGKADKNGGSGRPPSGRSKGKEQDEGLPPGASSDGSLLDADLARSQGAPGLFSYLSDEQLKKLAITVKTLERMVNQNIYDEITQDFRYWEDMSDEYKGKEGSLLPLWRFSCSSLSSLQQNNSSSSSSSAAAGASYAIKGLLVTEICWSPIYPDLFAAAYSTAESSGGEGAGAVCLYTLKNPSAPERILRTESGVTSVHFHPTISSIVAAGRTDGAVSVYDVTSPNCPAVVTSTAIGGKHLLPVTQVRWLRTEPGEKLSLFSVSLDGRVVQWHLEGHSLVATDLLKFPNVESTPSHSSGQLTATPSPDGSSTTPMPQSASSPTSMTSALSDTSSFNAQKSIVLEGTGTHIAVKPDDESVLLIGCDSGAVFQCSTTSTIHSLTRYDAHSAPVRALAWNKHNSKVFLSASVDWSLKIWLQYFLNPLIVVDLGCSVADVAWAPYSSTVAVAATDDAKIHVFDLHVRRCRPLCVQGLTQKKKVVVASVAISPFHPVILVAGDKGHLVCLKLSPNLRRLHKEAKGADEQRLREIEVNKIERIIATNRG